MQASGRTLMRNGVVEQPTDTPFEWTTAIEEQFYKCLKLKLQLEGLKLDSKDTEPILKVLAIDFWPRDSMDPATLRIVYSRARDRARATRGADPHPDPGGSRPSTLNAADVPRSGSQPPATTPPPAAGTPDIQIVSDPDPPP